MPHHSREVALRQLCYDRRKPATGVRTPRQIQRAGGGPESPVTGRPRGTYVPRSPGSDRSPFPVLVAALIGRRVDHVRETVAVAVLEVGQVQPIGLADIGQSIRDD